MVVKKHAHPKTGFKTESKAFLNQHDILGGKGMIYTTPASNGNFYFRTWIAEEKKYVRKGLRTKVLEDAIKKGEDEMLGILTKLNTGHTIFGIGWGDVCRKFLEHTQERVNTDRITQGRYGTIKTQIQKWIIPYIGDRTKISELDRSSFVEFGMYRRKQTKNQVEDVTIRNEYTTVNSIIKFAARYGYLPFERVDVEQIKIHEAPRRDTFTPEEYKVFYTRMRKWVGEASDFHEDYMRRMIRDFILIKSNAFPRFGELIQMKWEMTQIVDYKGEKVLKLDLPAHICKNRKRRTVIAKGGRYLERIKEYSEFTEPDDFVFSHPTKRKVLSKPVMYKYWKEVMEYSGLDKLDKKLTYYSLRHFGITARLMAKVPVYEVSKIAGTSVRFIETHYEHLDMGMLLDTALKSFTIDENGFAVRE